MKAERAAEESKNAARSGAGKAGSCKGATDDPTRTMLVDAFENFDTGDKDHLLFSQVIEKFITIPNSWLLLDSDSTIDIISNKTMVINIQRSSKSIILHCNAGSRQVEYTANLNGYRRV